MHIGRRLLAFGLFAVIPALGSAQEAKLVNCRTLEAAGNFVGPDEVIVDDMVCQRVKAGANAAAKQQAQKPLIGTVVSDAPTDNLVDAAKAAEKRVAIRREQGAAKSAIAAPADNEAGAAAPSSTAPREAPMSSAAASATVAAPAASTKDAEPAPAPASTAPAATGPVDRMPAAAVPDAMQAVAPVPDAIPANGASAAQTVEAPPQPLNHSATAEAKTVESTAELSSTPRVTGKAGSVASNEMVIPSAPTSPPATAPPSSEQVAATSASPEPTTPASTAESTPATAPPSTPAPEPPADPSRPATPGDFYDANAPRRSANVVPQTNTGFASAEQVNAGLTPGATSVPQSAAATGNATLESSVTSAEPETEVQHTAIAAARIDFDADRERSVKLGDFSKPRDVAPDPNAEHRTSVDPSDQDGFQDRQRPDCMKNVTLAGLSGERLVLGVPSWAAKWIEKNEKRLPQICFSETPMKGARNYLIVFSTPAGQVSKEAADAAVNPGKGASAAGVGTFTTLYGSTWHYSFDRNVGTTILTQEDADEPHGEPGQVLYATAYTEEGVPVAQRWPGQLKKELKPNEKNPKKLKGENEALEHVSSDLLGQMVEDIEKL